MLLTALPVAKIVFWAVIVILAIIVIYILIGPLVVGSDEVAVLEKRFGKSLQQGEFLALNKEAGFQADILRTGLHFKCRIIYKVHKCPMITINQDEIGYVFARSGAPLEADQALGRGVECGNFQDARAFIKNGGQKGMQREILREGTYAFNLAQFVIITEARTYMIPIGRSDGKEIQEVMKKIAEQDGFHPLIIAGEADVMGTVITNEGLALSQTSDITGKEVVAGIVGNDPSDPETYHNNFQKIDAFIKAGGCKGRQLQVLTQGKYYINRLFATVALQPNVVIGPSEVGVVTAYFGRQGKDISGESYTHGDLVEDGCKGVLARPLKTGKYPLNPYAYKVDKVPVENFVLRWISGQHNEYNYDANLRELSVITHDGLRPEIPLSVVVHIDYNKAPMVIQRFGSVQKLVEQTIDPMISAHFKKVAEKKTFIDFVQEKAAITDEVKDAMGKAFMEFNLEIEDILIDTPKSDHDPTIENMISQLSNRQLAIEETATYEQQMVATKKKKELNEAVASADMQTGLTQSSVQIDIDANKAEAQRRVAEKEKEILVIRTDANKYQTEVNAEANATKMRIEASAEAEKIKAISDAKAHETEAVGTAAADAAKKSVAAYGGAEMLVRKDVLMAFASAIEKGQIAIVPKNYINNGGSSSSANGIEQLLSLLSLEKLGADFKGSSDVDPAAAPAPSTAADTASVSDSAAGMTADPMV